MLSFSMKKALPISFVLLLVVLQSRSSSGANILALFTSGSPSHVIVEMSIAIALADRGHNITVVTSIEPVLTHKSIRNIVISAQENNLIRFHAKLNEFLNVKETPLSTMQHILDPAMPEIMVQYDVVADARFKALYTTPDTTFDLVILGYFLNDFQLGVAAKFKCPVILSWCGVSNPWIDKMVGNPKEAAYVPPPVIAMKRGEVMSFQDRAIFLVGGWLFGLVSLILEYRAENLYNELFSEEKGFPSLKEMRRNVSLLFLNSHFTEGPIRPNVPALVEIGGIQIKHKPDPLPTDIAHFLNASRDHGAVLFSLGTHLRGDKIKPELIKNIFSVLASLKQNVICKWEDLNNVPIKATNILYKEWIPQDDILAHPNMKLFITHAGKGGIAEAQYHAVPMIGLPVFGDQFGNADQMVLNGFGLTLNLMELNFIDFKTAILEVLTNPTYARNVKEFSVLYRDRPLSARQSVVYWTEYVLRYHGAKHMQSPLVHMNFIQSGNLDVISFLLVVVYLIWRLMKFVLKFIWNPIFSWSYFKKMKQKKQ